MMLKCFKNFDAKKTGLFAAGVLFGTAGIKILSSKDAKKLYTNCTAAVLRAKEVVLKTATKVQENAGLYVNMPATQDKGGNWKDVCWPVTAEFRKQLNDALIDGYGQAIENLQATLEATKGAAEKPSLTGALKENAGKVKEQPTKPAPSKNEQAR